jgi:AcrR family transcriptional regulator
MSKGAATRAAILRHAIEVASVQGLEALSIGRLADLTGLSKSGLFAHFGSKQTLQRSVLERVVEEFRLRVIQPALRETTGLARLRRLFAAWVEWATTDERSGACPLLGASIELDDRPGELRDYLVQRQRAWLDCIARMAARAVAEGALRADVDCEQLAFEINAIGLGCNFAQRLLGDERAAERAALSFERLLGATLKTHA